MYDAITKEQTIINGVNVDEFVANLEAITNEPALGKLQFRAENRWINGALNETSVKDMYGAGGEQIRERAHVMRKDEPAFLLGTDTAANPVEHLLAALAGCLTITLVFFASSENIRLDEVSARLEADASLLGIFGVDESVRMGCEEIRVTFDVKSEAPREKIEELLALAQSRSGVFDMLTNKTPVAVRLA